MTAVAAMKVVVVTMMVVMTVVVTVDKETFFGLSCRV
jgi:hypothetical protein